MVIISTAVIYCCCTCVFWQVYELNKGKLKLVHERETDAGIKCCTFGASSLENRHLVRFSPSLLQRSRLTAEMCGCALLVHLLLCWYIRCAECAC